MVSLFFLSLSLFLSFSLWVTDLLTCFLVTMLAQCQLDCYTLVTLIHLSNFKFVVLVLSELSFLSHSSNVIVITFYSCKDFVEVASSQSRILCDVIESNSVNINFFNNLRRALYYISSKITCIR